MEADLARSASFREVVVLDDDARYDVASLVAPVRSADGGACLLVRVSQLPAASQGSTVKAWITALKRAAAHVERALEQGTGRARLDAYHAWLTARDA